MLKPAFILAFALTLATWGLAYHYYNKRPLNLPETIVVFGLWLGLTLLGLWLKKCFIRKKTHG
jgi:hypothetical protein